MSRLQDIALRRSAVILETLETRHALGQSAKALGRQCTQAAIGLAVSKLAAGRSWLSVLALGATAFTAYRRWRGRAAS